MCRSGHETRKACSSVRMWSRPSPVQAVASPTRCTSNGCPKFNRRASSDLPSKVDFRSTPKYIATIDFGTTHCSLAYVLRPDLSKKDPSKIKPTTVDLDGRGSRRIPNATLFNEHGELLDIGNPARHRYQQMDKSLRPRNHYFEHVKKLLQPDQSLDRDTKVHATNGKPFFLLLVIAALLYELKNKLFDHLKDFGREDLKPSDFDWVITVPAIWKAKGKKLMREAGYKARLWSDGAYDPPKLSVASGSLEPQPEEKFPEKLSLALESEAAAIHCRQKEQEKAQDPNYHTRTTHYIVIDGGGGTIDIASHSIVEERIEEIAKPKGNFWGGTSVNEAFSTFLQGLVNDPGFSTYHKSSEAVTKSKHEADEMKLLYTDFEAQKVEFGSHAATRRSQMYLVQLPQSFWRQYENTLTETVRVLNEEGDNSIFVENDDHTLKFTPSKMEEFFTPAVEQITDLIASHLAEDDSKVGRAIDTIYWVGGFGSSKYLRRKVEANLTARIGKQYRYPVFPDPDLAVVLGAVAFRCNPATVRKRKADATYGIEGMIDFIGTLHRPEYRERLDHNQKDKCKNIFCAIVEEGEDVCTNEMFVYTFNPKLSDQRYMSFTMYSSQKKNVMYITDECVCPLGSISVDMGGDGAKRIVELVIDFTHTEIQVRAFDIESRNKTSVVIDFF